MTDDSLQRVIDEIRLVAERFIGDRDYEFGGKLNEWAERIESALSAQTEARDDTAHRVAKAAREFLGKVDG